MSTPPPWGWRPERVPDSSLYTDTPPPEPSERCTYWLNRLCSGSWTPDMRHLQNKDWSEQLGIWSWEWTNLILPAAEMIKSLLSLDQASRARADLRDKQKELNEKERELRRNERALDEELAVNRQFLVTAIINHGGYLCTDPDCVLECVQDAGESP